MLVLVQGAGRLAGAGCLVPPMRQAVMKHEMKANSVCGLWLG